MTLTIVILTCNQREHTLRLLESLLPYMKSHRGVEAVIVDNGSIDGTTKAIRTRLESVAKDVSVKVKIIELPENVGVAAGRNIGASGSSAEFIMFLDNDTIISPEAIDGLIAHINENPRSGICAPALHSPQGEVQLSAKPYPSFRIKLAHLLRPGHDLQCERNEMLKPHPWYVIGACQMMRRSTYADVGPLDEHIFYGPEDADYCARVRKAGLTIDYLPHLSMTHDWQRVTRRNPLSCMGLRHACSLFYFWFKTLTNRR